MVDKIKLTEKGKKDLENELYNLVNVTREEVKRQLAEARAQGDLSENADYDAARNKQAEIEERINQIRFTLDNCELISENVKNKNKVSLGSSVTIRNLETNVEATYMIVGTVESDPFNGKISNACPLGEAIIGKQVGDEVEVKGAKRYSIKIINLEK